jgi:hypothetical protein
MKKSRITLVVILLVILLMVFWIWYRLRDIGAQAGDEVSTQTFTATDTPLIENSPSHTFTAVVTELATATLTPENTPTLVLPTIELTLITQESGG